MKPIRILHGVLQPSERGLGAILRGVVHNDDLRHLRVPDYQRADLHTASVEEAFHDSTTQLPDIDVGMRGHHYERDGDTFKLFDPCFLIDGLQRTFGALRYLDGGGDDKQVEIGVTVHFDTTEVWERNRFEVLNRNRVRISTDLLLRNRKDQHPLVQRLYDLSQKEEAFALYNKVGWGQRRNRGELIGGVVLLKVVLTAHKPFVNHNINSFTDILRVGDALVRRLGGTDQIVDNTLLFFDVMDECWSIRKLQFARKQTAVKDGFLSSLARLCGDHAEFWRPAFSGDALKTQLFVSNRQRRKMASFDVEDRHISDLAGSASAKTSRSLLYEMLVRHMNSSRSTRMEERDPVDWDDPDPLPPAAPGAGDAAHP